MRRGLTAFVLLSIAATAGVFFTTSTPASLPEVLARASPVFLATLLLAPPVDWLVSGLRLLLFSRVLSPEVSYGACVRNCAVGAFMGAVTPSQTGGGIAQVYALAREGATVAQALTMLFMTFLSTLVFYFALSVALWAAAAGGAVPGVEASSPFLLAVAAFGTLAGLGVATLVHPAGARRVLSRAAGWLHRRHLRARFADRLGEVLDQCGASIEVLGRGHWPRFVASVGLSVLVFGNRYFAGYLAARALGLDPPLVQLLATQAFLNVLLYFFPTPGASGGAEISSAVLMAPLVPAALLAPFTLLWRTATTYLSVLVGGWLLARYVRRAAGVGPEAR